MKWRIWLLSLGIMLTSVLIFGFASTQVYYNSAIDDSKEYLRVYMNYYNESYSPDTEGAKALSEKLNGARVTFMDSQGKVLGDSIAEVTENHLDRTEIHDAIFNGEGFAVRSSSTLGKNMIYYCKNFDGKFLVRIATFAGFTGIMLALCVIIAVVSSHFILSPVKKLAEQAKHGEVEPAYHELEPVAEILNERNRSIKRQMDEIRAEKELADRARTSKDEFISNVTHEMNTPLTSIHGYAELLNAGGLNAEQQSGAYKTILAQSERLTNLIACIINFSEIDNDSLPSYEVDFSALAKEMIYALKPEADKRGITINENIKDGVIVLSRHERLNELFGNLLRNAVKYNKQGGTVTVCLTERGFSVEDTGIGISEENIGKVFSRFFTVDKSHSGKNGGFGLGLAVAKKICVKSGWNITAESKLGEGSKFTVEF